MITLNRRRVMGAKGGYTAVEYIYNSTDNSVTFLITDVYPLDDKWEFSGTLYRIYRTATYATFFLTGSNDQHHRWRIAHNNSDTNIFVNAWYKSSDALNVLSKNTAYSFTLKKGQFKIGTNTITIPTSGGGTQAGDTALRMAGGQRIYPMTIKHDGQLVAYLQPIVDKDGNACLLNTVTGNYFYPSNQASWFAGPNV